MRILLVNKFNFLYSGSERYLFNLQRLLQEHGHSVEVFAMQHPQNLPATYQANFAPQIDFHHLTLMERLLALRRVIWFPAAAHQISKVLDDFKPDIVHLHNIYHQLSPAILPEITRRGIPILQTLNDYKLICPNYLLYTCNQVCYRCKNHQYVQAIRYRCLHGSLVWSAVAALELTLHKQWQIYEKSVDYFISPSRFLIRKAVEFGEPAEKFTQIPYFIDQQENISQDRTLPGKYIAYIGRLNAEKGLHTLIQSMVMLPQVPLWLVGEGPLRASLEAKVHKLGLINVHFKGYQTGEELHQIYGGAQFTILPSEWPENFPNAILESFRMGRPVIGANVGGIPELIGEGTSSCGMLFPAGNPEQLAACILQCWNSPEMVHQMGITGQQKVLQFFNSHTHYESLLQHYVLTGATL